MPTEEITHTAAMQFFQYGVLGVLVVVFAAVIFFLWREGSAERNRYIAKIEELTLLYTNKLETIQQLRIDDGKAYQAQFVELTKQSTTAMMSVASLLDANKDTMSEVREAMREIAEDIRTSRRKP